VPSFSRRAPTELIADRPEGAAAAPATVLLVTGDPARRHAVAGRLREAGLAVHTAAGGPGALAAARRRPPDLLLLLLRDASPAGGGPRVCRAVRAAADRRLRTVPILVLADGATERELIDGLEAGADAYVAAPVTLRELQARVKALLRRAPRSAVAAAPLVAGDLVLDLAGRRLLRRGHPVELRRREFDLLAFLLAHAGGVFTRPQLLARIWGTGFAGGERTVDVHVRRLREKLERHPRRPALLETVRGVGYRLRPPRADRSSPALAPAPAAVGPGVPDPAPPPERSRAGLRSVAAA